MLLKIGGGNREAGSTTGIHWHMNINNKIEYYATDERRQVIPWVKSTNGAGESIVYKSTELDFDEKEIKNNTLRKMDCIDCHNRPAHLYGNPSNLVNEYMALGWIDEALPDIKSLAVETLDAGYSTKSNALDSIGIAIRDHYDSDYPEIATREKAKIDTAIVQIQKIYQRNYFPAMKVDWKKYPDNIGHLYSDGCFRCHDGNHMSDDGKVLTRDCNSCHTILDQKLEGSSLRLSLGGIDYQHPVDIDGDWKDTNCSECHGE